MRVPAKTKHVKVKVEFVVEYDREISGVPAEWNSFIHKFLYHGLRGAEMTLAEDQEPGTGERPRIVAYEPGAKWSLAIVSPKRVTANREKCKREAESP